MSRPYHSLVRIHIIGGSGSGKTTLAQKLSQELGIPHFDLDEMFWDDPPGTYGKRREESARDALLSRAVQQPDWIIEGVYDKWVLSSFKAADYVIVLQPALILRLYRLVRRFIRRKLGLEPHKREKISYLFRLIIWTFEYEAEHTPRFLETLRKNQIPFRQCRNTPEALDAISKISRT